MRFIETDVRRDEQDYEFGVFIEMKPNNFFYKPHLRVFVCVCVSVCVRACQGDDEATRKGQVLTLLAEQALQCLDFKASYIHCQDLMAAGTLLAQR